MRRLVTLVLAALATISIATPALAAKPTEWTLICVAPVEEPPPATETIFFHITDPTRIRFAVEVCREDLGGRVVGVRPFNVVP
jgi:hypothetical protein